MKNISGVILDFLPSETDAVCQVVLMHNLTPYFKGKEFIALVQSIGETTEPSIIKLKLEQMKGQEFEGIMLMPIGENKILISINSTLV